MVTFMILVLIIIQLMLIILKHSQVFNEKNGEMGKVKELNGKRENKWEKSKN